MKKTVVSLILCVALLLVCLAGIAAPAVYEPDFQMISLDTGISMRYALIGDADGAPMVMIHGATDSYLSYAQLAQLMAEKGYAVYVPELRGHGGTDKPDGGAYTLDQHAKDIYAFMSQLGITGAYVVGHSLGSFVAQAVTAEYGEELGIVELGLIGTGASTVGNPTLSWMLYGDDDFPGVKGFEAGVPEEFIEEWVANSNEDADFTKHTLEHALSLPEYVWINIFFGLEELDHTEALGKIACPVRIVWGSEDVFFSREDQLAVIAALTACPEVSLYTLPGASHNTHWDAGAATQVAEMLSGS